MDIKSFYETIGGNYNEAISRLMNDSLIEKFLIKFSQSNYIEGVKKAIQNNDLDDLFFQAHTLKGVALNLSLARLGSSASALTDYVRGDNKQTANMDVINKLYCDVETEYKNVIDRIKY